MPQQIVERKSSEVCIPNDELSVESGARLCGPRLDEFVARTFPEIFEDQVTKHSEKIAVVCEQGQLTYAELNARANQLACHLRALGVGWESLVGICIDRSLEMAVGILGILKAGAAYLPLDPDYPRERLAFMLNDACPAIVLTKSTLANLVSNENVRTVLLDRVSPKISERRPNNPTDKARPSDLAYVIYTSGSTGGPKGVEIEHRNLANYLLALNRELEITPQDSYLHTASIAFSSSRRQLLLPLSQGATVVIASAEERKDPLALFTMIKERGVTIMDCVPSFWRSCTSALTSLDHHSREELLDNKLRLMLSASEPLPSDIPRTWLIEFNHQAQHIHMFGQTETAGIVSLYRIPPGIDGARVVPIGRPIANSEIFILDEERRPCALGVAGELYIGGAGVGRGYLNRPELTSEKFVGHPFSNATGAQFYRTGDFARLNADGQIEYAGRRDQQVKLRGFRVELAEVETALASHPAVREAAVIARGADDHARRLTAYFVANGAAPNASDLREFLNARLPDYQVPAAFVLMNALPLSANGKVDRHALPDPDTARPELASAYVAPRSDLEKRLTEIWSEVLRIDRIGINDNFFELGGNSLLATQVVSRTRNQFKIQMSLRALFEQPTVAQMAAKVRSAAPSQPVEIRPPSAAERNGNLPLSVTQQSLWFLNQLEPESSAYNMRTAIKISGALDVEVLRQALEAIVARHEILRTNFVAKEDRPIQFIHATINLPFELIDLRKFSATDREAEVERLTRAEAQQPFNLAAGPLLRVKLVRLQAQEFLLLLTAHHITMDGWSIMVLRRELTVLYQSFSERRPSLLPSLPIQFADYSMWQSAWLESDEFAEQLKYWKQKLAGAPAVLNLPACYPRPDASMGKGAEVSRVLPAQLSEAIKQLSRQEDATLFMTLLAAFQALLCRHSGQDDIVVGAPLADRTLAQTEDLIGPFMNTLVFRTRLSGNPTFRELLARVRETSLAAYAHQDVPFERLVEELRPKRSANVTPLFQVMFALQNLPASETAINGLRFTPQRLSSMTAKFDLTLGVTEEPDGLRAAFEYNADLFTPEAVERLVDHFQALLAAIAADPEQRLSDLLNEELFETLAPTWQLPISEPELVTAYQAPRGPIEERLAEIWQEVLRLERVGVNDNFFELGGHSLLATQVVSRIRRTFEVDLPLRSFFKTSTIAGLAEAIYQSHTEETEDAELGAMLAELRQLSDEEARLRFADET